MRLWPILLTLFALAFAGPARAADYQVLWHQPDQATLVDVGSMRESGATRQAETLDLVRAADHPVAYRHRLEIDCAGKRARLLAARQVDLTTEASYVELEAVLPRSKPQGWYGVEPGSGSGRLLAYMCRPTLTEQARALVRDSSPTEAARAYVRQWCDGERGGRLSKSRWKSWRKAFDELGLPVRRSGWMRLTSPTPALAIMLMVMVVASFFIGLRKRRNVVRAQAGTVAGCFVCLAAAPVLAGAGLLSGEDRQLLILTVVGGVMGLIGLALLPYALWWRVLITRKGFTHTDYWGRSTTWLWTDVEAVGVRDLTSQLLVRMTGGKVLRLGLYFERISIFLNRVERAKGWGEGGPVKPVAF